MDEPKTSFRARVWVSCHPEDYAAWFRTVMFDLLCIHSCEFFSACDPLWESEDERNFAFSTMQLVVIPVTRNLLLTKDGTVCRELATARKMSIPVIPIMMEPVEPGFDSLYKDIFGNLQYLDRATIDKTAVPYSVKLRNYLNNILPSEIEIQKIYNCFDARLFISYRKKDRLWANKLMQIIHKNPQFRDVGIFYDELLTPGESFESELAQQLVHSDLILMVVTPSILESVINSQGKEDKNYVEKKEYPLAIKKEKTIIPVEFVPTNQKEFRSKYQGVGPCLVFDEADNYVPELETALTLGLVNKALRQKTSLEQDYLIGLAYLHGIYVEVDRIKGLQLITESAIAGLLDAQTYLEGLYWAENGLHKDILAKTLECERRLQQLQGEQNYSEKRFELLCEAGEAYLFLSNPYERPAHTIQIAVDRAGTYLKEAVRMANAIELPCNLRQKLCYALVECAKATDDKNLIFHYMRQYIATAYDLVTEDKNENTLSLLADMYGYAVGLLEGDLSTINKAAVFYRQCLSDYVKTLEALLCKTRSKRDVRRLLDILYLQATVEKRCGHIDEAISCYQRSIEVASKYKHMKMTGALYLAQIYAQQGKTELSGYYMRMYMDSTKQ